MSSSLLSVAFLMAMWAGVRGSGSSTDSSLLRGAWSSFSPELSTSSPKHPGDLGYFDNSYTETMVHSVDGKVVRTGTGKWGCDWGGLAAPLYIRASWQGTVKLTTPRPNGAAALHTVWLGWNNLLTNRVDRYLIVKEMDVNGKVLKEKCTTYPDVNPKGYKDPLQLMVHRYKLTHSSSDFSEYVYQWKLQNEAEMTSTMIAGPNGFPPRSVSVKSNTKDGHESLYNFSYAPPSHGVDPSVFYEYKKFDCETVSNFTTPDVCVDPWLAIQYECSFTEGLETDLEV